MEPTEYRWQTFDNPAVVKTAAGDVFIDSDQPARSLPLVAMREPLTAAWNYQLPGEVNIEDLKWGRPPT